ncbi:AI-2E family transporter [Phycicoccus avicenniae]|uniref:AI-2E family transporter n=1 Tax=Phycicoccus avicenniae TaxID=2828860 RepID=UPI003D2BFF41
MRLSTLWAPVERWGEFRRRQRAALEESNRLDPADVPDVELLPVEAVTHPPEGGAVPGPTSAPTSGPLAAFGAAGQPLNRHSPFYLGFFGASGAMLAFGLWTSLGRLATTITLLLVSFFLALALNPVVDRLARRMPRGAAVTLVFSGLILAFVVMGFLVVPPVVDQGGALVQQAPSYVTDLLNARWVRDLDQHYDVIDRLQTEVNARLTDQSFIGGVLGGILGAGRAVLSGVFQVLTVLVLTLYLLASLPRVKHAAYALVPASRRPRVASLSEEIMRRVGSYAIGQVAIATLNACMSWLVMTILGVPYAAVLAVSVGLLGLVPMVGATLGASLVCVVAFFDEPRTALILLVYYVVYQQIENYVIAPRVMQRTVSVPGTVTIIAALTGGALLGVLGALLAIPVAAGMLLLYEEVLVPRQNEA